MELRNTVKRATMALVGWAAIGTSAFAADEATITDIEVESGEVRLIFEGSAASASISAFAEVDPDRALVDMLGVSLGEFADTRFEAEEPGLVQAAALSLFTDDSGDITRLTVFLSEAATPTVDVIGNKIILTAEPASKKSGNAGLLEALEEQPAVTGDDSLRTIDSSRGVSEGPGTPSGPQTVDGVSLTSIDYVDEESVARVVIGSSAGIDFVSSQPNPKMVVVDFPGAAIPRSLRRPLDASRFISPVRVVRAVKTSSGARVAISLREGTPWAIHTKEDGLVYVDFTLSEELREARRLAAQSFSEVAPSGPKEQGQEGLKGAYTEEKLIGETGKAMNPQAVFGDGKGARNPASLIGGMGGFTLQSDTASSSQWVGKNIVLNLEEAPIHTVFRMISYVSGLNIVSGDDVKGTVTVSLKDVPWDHAFSAILKSKGLAAQQFGTIVRVAPIETIKAEQQAMAEAQVAKEKLTPLQILVLPLNYAKATEVATQISAQQSERGSVEVDSRSNQVIIHDTEANLAQLRELVKTLDQETPQVMIEARVVEASSRYTRSLGIQWGGQLDSSARTGYSTGLLFPNSIGVAGGTSGAAGGGGGSQAQFFSPGSENLAVDLGATSSFGSLAFNLGSVSSLVDIDARLSAMESDGWGEIVSSPRITTLDNTTAQIRQGARIPYLSTSSGGTQVEFIVAALTLEVTPHITSDGKIFMKMNIENNRPDFSQAVQGQPAIQIKEASTELLVADGDTTVIGGVFSTEEAENVNRVPLFGKIPLLGWMFRSKDRTVARNEMLVFVTPRIVTNTIDE